MDITRKASYPPSILLCPKDLESYSGFEFYFVFEGFNCKIKLKPVSDISVSEGKGHVLIHDRYMGCYRLNDLINTFFGKK